MENHHLYLKPIQDADLSILNTWLHKEYILKWYNYADEWMNEVRERYREYKFLNHYMVWADDMPVGFCQYYDCYDAQEEWYAVDKPGRIFSIDYLIGEESFLGKGYGKSIVRKLIDIIREQGDAQAIVVQPDIENIPSCKALEANGFVYDIEKKYYILEF